MHSIIPPEKDWENVQRIEYWPGTKGPRTGQGTPLLGKRMTLGATAEYTRTWSTYHHWQNKWPERMRRGEDGNGSRGDVIDDMMEEIVQGEPRLRKAAETMNWRDIEVDVEWESAIILARRRADAIPP